MSGGIRYQGGKRGKGEGVGDGSRAGNLGAFKYLVRNLPNTCPNANTRGEGERFTQVLDMHQT